MQRFFNSFPNDTFLDSSKLKEFADNNFEFYKTGRKLPKCVENTVGKGEIAYYEQFLLFPQCFKRPVLQTRKNKGLFGKELNPFSRPVLIYFKWPSGESCNARETPFRNISLSNI